MNKKLIGERIRTLRKAQDLTQEQLAGESNVAQRVLQKIEAAASDSNPTLSTMESLSERLGTSVSKLTADPNEPLLTLDDLAGVVSQLLTGLRVHPIQRYLALFFLTGRESYLRDYLAYVKDNGPKAGSFDLSAALQAIRKLAASAR